MSKRGRYRKLAEDFVPQAWVTDSDNDDELQEFSARFQFRGGAAAAPFADHAQVHVQSESSSNQSGDELPIQAAPELPVQNENMLIDNDGKVIN